jgi:5-methylthioadenosine/S-adenosylhomocysteine deaminase
MSASLIHGRYLLTRARDRRSIEILEDGAILQRDGEIVEIGRYETLQSRHPDVQAIGSRRHLVMPGLVNAHHHIGVTHSLAGCMDGPLELWLAEVWARRDIDPWLDTLWGATQLLRSGVTTVMHNVVRWIVPSGDGLLEVSDAILRGYRKAGLRVAYSIGMKERNLFAYGDDEQFLRGLPAPLAEDLRKRMRDSMSADEYLALFETLHARHAGDRVRLLLSPSNLQWASDDLLMKSKRLAVRHGAGIHMHLAETRYQKQYAERTYGKPAVAHLAELGFLGPEVSCAHGAWLGDEELDQLAAARSVVCHNPSSNLRLQNGVAPVQRMLERGIAVALGNDSSGINDDQELLQEVRLASALHRGTSHDAPRLTPADLLQMATLSGARACRMDDRIGTLERGKRADAVLVNLERLNDGLGESELEITELLFQRGRDRHIDTVLIDGEVVFADGAPTHFDCAAVAAELRERFSRPRTPHEAQRRAIASELRPYVRDFYRSWQ